MAEEWKYKDLPTANGKVAPAVWDETIKDWVVYDGVDKAALTELQVIKQQQQEILTRMNQDFTTQLTGSIVEEFQGHDAVAIRDTTSYDSRLLDIHEYGGSKMLLVQNTLNQTVNIGIGVYNKNGLRIGSSESWVRNSGAWGFATSQQIPILNHPLYSVVIFCKCDTAPTSGFISTWLEVTG